MLVGLIALCFSIRALSQGEVVLDPHLYGSPSGAVTLWVEPSRRDGGGPASYVCARGDDVLWRGRRPFTLWEVVVAEDGTVAGYAYGAGLSGGEDDVFLVTILAPDGSVRLEERTERRRRKSVAFDTPPIADPTALGCLLDPAGERLVVLVANERGPGDAWTFAPSMPTLRESGAATRFEITSKRMRAGLGARLPACEPRTADFEFLGSVVLDFAPEEDERFSLVALGLEDRIHAVRTDSGRLAVFTRRGEPLHECRELSSSPGRADSLSASATGEVLLDGRRYSASGTPRGATHFRARKVRHASASGLLWGLGEREILQAQIDGTVVQRIQRAPDGSWLPYLTALEVAPDGSLAAYTHIEHAPSFFLYDARGMPVRCVPTTRGSSDFAFDGRHLVLRPARPGVLVWIDTWNDEQLELLLPRAGRWKPMFAAGGSELWLFDGESRIERYRCP